MTTTANIIMTSIFASIILTFIMLGIYNLYYVSKYNIDSIKQVFKGCISNKEFDMIMVKIFSDPECNVGKTVVSGGGYIAHIGNFDSGLSINNVEGFSVSQIKKLKKIINKIEVQRLKNKVKENLKL